LLGIAFHII